VSAFFCLGISQQWSCEDKIPRRTCAGKGCGISVLVCVSSNWYSLRFSSHFQFTIQNNPTNRRYLNTIKIHLRPPQCCKNLLPYKKFSGNKK